MAYLKTLSGMVMAAGLAALAACGSDSSTPDAARLPPDANTTPDASAAPDAAGGFTQPTGTVAVNFTVDDMANKVYTAGSLEWKGAMAYDSTTRKITMDSTWTGPFAPLYDDGPWTAGGHEPKGSVAGDHKWGVTVFATPPATSSDTYAYGLNDATYQNAFGNGWIWVGTNGSFSVAAGATAEVTASGMTFLPFGTNDLQITLDLSQVNATAFDTSVIKIKGTATGWNAVTITPSGNSAVFTLSAVVGAGHTFAHNGLLNTGDKPEWNWLLGAGDGKEYKDANGKALATGVTAKLGAEGAALTIGWNGNNTNVTIP